MIVMSNIYIITRGDYSSYRILCATTDKKIAKAILAKSGGARMETYEEPTIDDFNKLKSHDRYVVIMDKNGNTKSTTMSNDEYKFALYNEYAIWRDETLCVTTWATNALHAIKIANELRTQLLAAQRYKAGKSGVF